MILPSTVASVLFSSLDKEAELLYKTNNVLEFGHKGSAYRPAHRPAYRPAQHGMQPWHHASRGSLTDQHGMLPWHDASRGRGPLYAGVVSAPLLPYSNPATCLFSHLHAFVCSVFCVRAFCVRSFVCPRVLCVAAQNQPLLCLEFAFMVVAFLYLKFLVIWRCFRTWVRASCFILRVSFCVFLSARFVLRVSFFVFLSACFVLRVFGFTIACCSASLVLCSAERCVALHGLHGLHTYSGYLFMWLVYDTHPILLGD